MDKQQEQAEKRRPRLAVNSRGFCIRCRQWFGRGDRCPHCGVSAYRKVMSLNSSRRRSKIGGKRGHNSGRVSQHGKKG